MIRSVEARLRKKERDRIYRADPTNKTRKKIVERLHRSTETFQKANRIYQLKWRNDHAVKERRRSRDWWRQLRLEVLAALGGVCACCGESHVEFLTVDHVNGDGAEERKKIGTSTNFFVYVKRSGYPRDRYQVLCYNCNCSKGHYGYCPHEKAKA